MEVIQLGDVDLNCPHNCKCHNTHFFGTDRQTVRRGQAFDLYVHFQNREWDDSVDKISFTVETGLRPCESKEMKCTFPLGRCIDQTCWSACYKPHQHRCINISVFPPIDACIGRHILNMSITSCDRTFQQCLGDFDILFNPWCADDPVYMDNQAHREEYVLNEHGMLYEGVHKHVTSRPWHFGQFENGILDICLKVLDIGSNYHQGSERGCRWRNDPVHVSMVVNHMLCGHHSNSIMKLQDNNDYLKGTNPLTWNGSVPILQQWYNGRCRPVRFGDCLTLASVMCTVMRCLGIPSRVITNFCSPHCAENPLAVNELFDSTGKTLCGKDKLWAYHCWNESWMARRDLDLCSSNWQCLDPTPMESGRGSACCGPTSIRSVKDGELDLDYDGQHIFSRLNASCIGWLSKNSDKKEKLCYDAWLCGQCVSTKSVGNNHREDITGAYKYELGSLKGKEAFYKAYRRIHSGYCNAPNCHIDRDLAALQSPFLSDAGVSMRFKMINCPMYGQDVHLHWLLENLRNEPKNLNFNLCTQVLTHNGCALDQFWKENINVALGPREAKTIPLHISYNQYGHHLGDHNIMRLVAISDPECGGEVLVVKRDIVINRPTVAVKLLGLPRLNEPCTAEISFCNPLQEDLKNCVLNLEGCGLFKEPMTIDLGTLASNHQTRTVVEFIPYRHGCHRLLANFACHKFGYCKGYANADVCDPRCNSVPFPVCNSGTLPVCDSGSLPHGDSYVDYMCIPMCTSGNGSGSQPTFDYMYLPVGHPLCSSLRPSDSGFHIICDTMPSAMSAPMFHSVSGSVSAPTSSPVGQVVGGSASAPIPHPVQPPMPYSLSIPANNAMSALLSHFMAGSANSSVCYPVHTPVSHAVSGTMPTSASHPPSGLVSHAACSSVSTPASHFLNAPVSHAACGFMSTPVSHPLNGPVSHAVSTPASHPICTPMPHAMSAPASHPICTPVSHAMFTPASRPICTPVSHAMSSPASRPICTPVSHAMSTPASHPICAPVSHAMSTPASHPICAPVSHAMSTPAFRPICAPVSHAMSTPASHPICTPVSHAMSTPASHPICAPVSHTMSTPTSHPICAPVSHAMSTPASHPICAPVSHAMSTPASHPICTPVSHAMSTPASHPICAPVSHTMSTPASHPICAPVSHTMSTPTSHPICTPVSHAMSTPASHPICAPVSHAMSTPASHPICTPVSHAMSTPASHPICAPVSHAMSTPASHPICAPVSHTMSTPASHPICAPVSHTMSTPTSHPICTPVSHAMSTPASHPICAPVSHTMSTPTSHPICTPVSHAMSTPASHPICAPVSHAMSTPASHPICTPVSHAMSTPASHPICTPMSHSMYGLASTSVSHPLSIPVSRAVHGSISNATSRSVSIPLARFVGPSASSPVARSLSHSVCSSHRSPLGSTVSRFSSQSAWVSRAVPASRFQCSSKLRSAYGTQSHSKSRSAYSALPHSASRSAYGTLTCSAWNCTL